MHIPKNYFHDRLIVLQLTVNAFLAIFVTALSLIRLRNGNVESFVGQYHSNLGLSAFEPGSASTFIGFAIFSVLVFALHLLLSMRMYHRRKGYAYVILWMSLFLLVFALVVSNALAVLQ